MLNIRAAYNNILHHYYTHFLNDCIRLRDNDISFKGKK